MQSKQGSQGKWWMVCMCKYELVFWRRGSKIGESRVCEMETRRGVCGRKGRGCGCGRTGGQRLETIRRRPEEVFQRAQEANLESEAEPDGQGCVWRQRAPMDGMTGQVPCE
jgi:hypothetical protein